MRSPFHLLFPDKMVVQTSNEPTASKLELTRLTNMKSCDWVSNNEYLRVASCVWVERERKVRLLSPERVVNRHRRQ